MKCFKIVPIFAFILLFSGCSILPAQTSTQPQLGLNFIRFFFEPEDDSTADPSIFSPESIFADFDELGVDAFRQSPKAELTWSKINPRPNEWNFEEADAVIMHADAEVIPTLFEIQYASPTPPWATNPRQFTKELNPAVVEYVTTVVNRYADYVTYWEIGNEMDHWRAYDSGNFNSPSGVNAATPSGTDAYPVDGFSPEEQGVFLAQVADMIRDNDPNAIIVMPGMSGLHDKNLEEWLPGVIAGGGTEWFDIVNYHYYGSWEDLQEERAELQTLLQTYNIEDKPVWLTETGSSSDISLFIRTNYPNSETSQAADIFRRSILAYAAGDTLVMWHTYIGSPSVPSNMWRDYGIIDANGVKKPAYYSFQLLAEEITPFTNITTVSDTESFAYEITRTDNSKRYVAWGSGDLLIPDGYSEYTSVIPNADGTFTWEEITTGDSLSLQDEPVLLR